MAACVSSRTPAGGAANAPIGRKTKIIVAREFEYKADDRLIGNIME